MKTDNETSHKLGEQKDKSEKTEESQVNLKIYTFLQVNHFDPHIFLSSTFIKIPDHTP